MGELTAELICYQCVFRRINCIFCLWMAFRGWWIKFLGISILLWRWGNPCGWSATNPQHVHNKSVDKCIVSPKAPPNFHKPYICSHRSLTQEIRMLTWQKSETPISMIVRDIEMINPPFYPSSPQQPCDMFSSIFHTHIHLKKKPKPSPKRLDLVSVSPKE